MTKIQQIRNQIQNIHVPKYSIGNKKKSKEFYEV